MQTITDPWYPNADPNGSLVKMLERSRTVEHPPPEGQLFHNWQRDVEDRLGFPITITLAWDLAGIERQWQRAPYKRGPLLRYERELGFPITERLVMTLPLESVPHSRAHEFACLG